MTLSANLLLGCHIKAYLSSTTISLGQIVGSLAMPFRKTKAFCCSELLRIWPNGWEFILYDLHNYCILDCQIIKMEELA